MKRLILAALLAPMGAWGQQPTPEELDGRIQAIVQQREANANQVAMLAGQLAKMAKELEAAKKECKPDKPTGEKK